MTKKLNVDAITNELAESAFFRRPQREQPVIDKPTPLPEKQIVQENQPHQDITERVNARSPVRPNGKRIITRNSFEIYEDQMDSLRKISLHEKVNHCPLKEAAFDNKFCSPIEGSQSLLDWASLGR